MTAEDRAAPRAVVSGLGPNGALAALELVRAGFTVTAVEQRARHERPIHLGVRARWLADVRALDPALHDEIAAVTAPIERFEHFVVDGEAVSVRSPALAIAGGDGADHDDDERTHEPDERRSERLGSIAARLREPPVVHARVDELERVLALHLDLLAARDPRLTIHRGRRLTLARCDGDPLRHEAVLLDVTGGPPVHLPRQELIVIAEGGKSSTAHALGLESRKVSPPKLYLSVHVRLPLGAVSRRMDTCAAAGAPATSAWATGHADRARGTWIVLEAPPSRASFDEDLFAVVAADLMSVAMSEDGRGARRAGPGERARRAEELRGSVDEGFRGTFRFEQQMLERAVAGADVVFLGDCAGMGHHALSAGLEAGLLDVRALRALAVPRARPGGGAPDGDIEAYARVVHRTRVELLALGMPEYFPALAPAPRGVIERAIEHALASHDDAANAFRDAIAGR